MNQNVFPVDLFHQFLVDFPALPILYPIENKTSSYYSPWNCTNLLFIFEELDQMLSKFQFNWFHHRRIQRFLVFLL